MPIYEYVCNDCGERFEQVRLMKDADTPTPCSACQGEHTSGIIAVLCLQRRESRRRWKRRMRFLRRRLMRHLQTLKVKSHATDLRP